MTTARAAPLLGAGALAGIVGSAGFLEGSMIGPSLTRRMPGNVLRVIAALAGLALAVRLWAGS